MEQDLVDVIVTVFEKVFHIQFDDKKEILMHLIEDAILNIEDDKRFRVKVAEDNALFLENPQDRGSWIVWDMTLSLRLSRTRRWREMTVR